MGTSFKENKQVLLIRLNTQNVLIGMKAKKKGKSKMEQNEIIEPEEIEALVKKTVNKHRLVFERLDEL